ncbi:MAG: hypothetical protein QNJ73_03200 [Gammaproteobacteria bacterium]|nr:hypothetical protein [Gammaproteobacteria bacterium]
MSSPAHSNRTKLLWTVAVAVLAAAALTGAVDGLGEEYAERAFGRALVTFAVARTLNGVISVAQGTELAVEPAGVGMIFSLGQILDPINDLVERFSTVMLVATSSLGLQNILLDMTSWWGVSALLLLIGAFLLVRLWWPAGGTDDTESGFFSAGLAIKLLLFAVFLRFAVPLLIIASTLVFDTFLAAEQAAAVQALEATSAEIEAVNEEVAASPVDEDASMLQRFNNWVDQSLDSLNVEERLKGLGERVSNATEHIINLIVIFVFQTILMPLLFLWLLAEALKTIAKRTAGLGG